MRRLTVIGLAAVSMLAFAQLAFAAEITRDQYKALVEPICQKNSKANERILKGVRKMVRRGKLKPASVKFKKAGRALKKTHRQLAAQPQPTADEARLKKWLSYVKQEANLFIRAGKKLQQGKKGAAQALVNKLTSNANKANALVLAFNFRYCKFEPSKFT
jgi:glutamate/tyrosine decarboxylase-like PLP-dependent enzyme